MATMNKTNKLFNKLVDSWNALQKARKKHKKGKLSKDELFDFEFYAFETEAEFIKQIEKIK